MPLDPVSRALRDLARDDPDRLALCYQGQSLTYGELDGETDALAEQLLDRLGRGQERVAVRIADPRHLAATPLALARAGKTAVMIDPTAPADRVRSMLNDSGSSLLLTDLADEDLDLPTVHAASWLGERGRPVDEEQPVPAALIYTSGSTGGPKAISVSAAHLDQLPSWAAQLGAERIGQRGGVLATGSVGNSIGFHRFAFALGVTLFPYGVRSGGLEGMTTWLLEERISAFAVIPTLLRFFTPSLPDDLVFPDLRIVYSYGESITGQDVKGLGRHLLPDAVISNIYGLSETGLIASSVMPAHADLPDGQIPVGRPQDGVTVEILGTDRTTVLGPEEKGEIAVTSQSLPDGYWNRDELTAQTFQRLPDGRTRVLTGDAGSLDQQGVLHHLGRLDDMVKVSGHRIALGDVEQALRELPGVDSAVAVGRPDLMGNVRLHAYVTGTAASDLDGRTLRTALARRLPPAMLPDVIGVLDAFPTLGSGKVDRRSLPEMQAAMSGADLEPGLESDIAALFCRVLQLPSVGPDDDFLQLGGDSLRVAELFAAMAAELGHDHPLSLVLEAPTPALLAAALRQGPAQDDTGNLVALRPEGSLPPLFVVHGALGNVVWIRDVAQHLDPDRPVYGIAAPALDGLWPEELALEELAARYLRSVRRVQPHGPYHFFGLSLGGAIAWEMARQLRAAGELIGYLAIGDTPLSEPDWPKAPQAGTRAERVRERGLTSALAEHLAWRLRRLRRGDERTPDPWPEQLEASRRGIPVPFSRRGDFVQHVYAPLLRAWKAESWDGAMTLFLPTTGRLSKVTDWEAVAGHVTTVTVPGDHYGLVREGADALSRSLDEGLHQRQR